MMRQVSDGALADSQDAYVKLLFEKYRAPLHRYLQRFVSKDDAGELVQEAYFRLMRHGNTVQMDALARSFLYQTATNLARDHLRRRKSRLADQHVSLEDEDVPASTIEPSDHLAGEQMLQAFEQALLRMPAETRQVFLLYRFRELSYAQIAAALGLSTRTVARRVSEAMDRLSDAVGGMR